MSEEELGIWKKNQNRYYLYFDGTSKHNPGKVGEGGVIFDPNEREIFTYEWGLGQISNNKTEAYSLLMGSRIIKKRRNTKSYNNRRLSHNNKGNGTK